MNLLPRSVRADAGFTLLELVFALILIGLVAGFAVPRMSGVVNWARLDGSAKQLAGDVVYARAVAVQHAERVTMEFTAQGYRIQREGLEAPVKQVNLTGDHSGLSLSLDGASGSTEVILGRLQFDSRGVLREGDGTGIELRREGRVARMVVHTTGKVTRAN